MELLFAHHDTYCQATLCADGSAGLVLLAPPDAATKANLLDSIDLLEPHLANPAIRALCQIAMNWYLGALGDLESTDLSPRLQCLVDQLTDANQ